MFIHGRIYGWKHDVDFFVLCGVVFVEIAVGRPEADGVDGISTRHCVQDANSILWPIGR